MGNVVVAKLVKLYYVAGKRETDDLSRTTSSQRDTSERR